MSLRPRYSLLTLLVLTALVAGGVKLWYVPHHVVEPDPIFPNWEKEYSYTLDWRGNRIIHGPVVHREYDAETLVHLQMSFYRQGNNSGWIYSCDVRNLTDYPKKGFGRGGKCPLTEHELREFYQVRDAELQRIVAMGKAIDNQEESDLVTRLTRPVQKSAYPVIKPRVNVPAKRFGRSLAPPRVSPYSHLLRDLRGFAREIVFNAGRGRSGEAFVAAQQKSEGLPSFALYLIALADASGWDLRGRCRLYAGVKTPATFRVWAEAHTT